MLKKRQKHYVWLVAGWVLMIGFQIVLYELPLATWIRLAIGIPVGLIGAWALLESTSYSKKNMRGFKVSWRTSVFFHGHGTSGSIEVDATSESNAAVIAIFRLLKEEYKEELDRLNWRLIDLGWHIESVEEIE